MDWGVCSWVAPMVDWSLEESSDLAAVLCRRTESNVVNGKVLAVAKSLSDEQNLKFTYIRQGRIVGSQMFPSTHLHLMVSCRYLHSLTPQPLLPLVEVVDWRSNVRTNPIDVVQTNFEDRWNVALEEVKRQCRFTSQCHFRAFHHVNTVGIWALFPPHIRICIRIGCALNKRYHIWIGLEKKLLGSFIPGSSLGPP